MAYQGNVHFRGTPAFKGWKKISNKRASAYRVFNQGYEGVYIGGTIRDTIIEGGTQAKNY